jgi:signal transduction histidine kinase
LARIDDFLAINLAIAWCPAPIWSHPGALNLPLALCLATIDEEFTMSLKRLSIALVTAALCVGTAAGEHATKDEAVAMVKKGVAFWKSNGDEKTFAAITDKLGPFHDRDLYLVVYALDGTVRAHGANEKMVGRNLIDLKDVDGKAFVRERVELAQKQSSFWQDYKFTDPLTKKIEPKQMYCERVDENVLCGGVYRQ